LDNDAPRHIRGVDLYDAQLTYAWGLTAYIVTPKGRDTVPAVMHDCLRLGPPGPVDILIKHACADGRLKGAVMVPFLATPLLESYAGTTIDGRNQAEDRLVIASAVRRMFYAGRIGDVDRFAQPSLDRNAGIGPQAQLLSRLMGHTFANNLQNGDCAIG